MFRPLKSVVRAMARALTARSAPPPPSAARNRQRLTLTQLEDRDVPAVWWVTNGNDSGSGSLRDAYASVEAAGNNQDIAIANDVTLITLDSPIETGAMSFTGLDIHTEDDHLVTIDASTAGAYRFFSGTSPNGTYLTMENLTITDFGADVVTFGGFVVDAGHGGAIQIACPLTLFNCTFSNNTAEGAGGAIKANYTLTATNCTFSTNEAVGSGGAIHCLPINSTVAGVTLSGCQFTQNRSTNGNGGAVFYSTEAGALTITDSSTKLARFISNKALNGHGGAIYQYGGTIYAVGAANGPNFGFSGNQDSAFVPGGAANGNSLYLEELTDATIDMSSNDDLFQLYLYSTIPPQAPLSGPTINASRLGSYTTNWSSGWFY